MIILPLVIEFRRQICFRTRVRMERFDSPRRRCDREREREMNSVNLMFFSSFTASGCAFPIYCPPRSRMNGTPVRNATVRLSDACPMNQVATAATVLCQGVGIKKQMEGSARTAWCQWTEKNQAEAPPFAPPKASNPTEKPSNTPANSVKTQ